MSGTISHVTVATLESRPGPWPTRAYHHRHTLAVAENDRPQLIFDESWLIYIPSSHDQSQPRKQAWCILHPSKTTIWSYHTRSLPTYWQITAHNSWLSCPIHMHFLAFKHCRTTAYHPHNNGQAWRYNRALTAIFPHDEAEQQHNWYVLVESSTDSSNAQVNHLTGTTPFRLVLSKRRAGSATYDRSSEFPTEEKNATAPSVLRSKLLHFIALIQKHRVAN